MEILITEDLRKYYRLGDSTVRALDGITLKVEKGEFMAVVGRSGSGKSTLLHMLGGLDVPTSGKVIVDGRDISNMTKDELTIFRRRKIGFVFQNYNLLPLMNVYENVILPIQLDGIKPDKKYVENILEMLGLTEKRSAMPNQLSGGQQQRVALARALAAKPAIILADEPTGNLDSRTSQDVLGLIKVSGEQLGQTVVMITHNEEIAQMAGRIIRLEDGRICGDGKACVGRKNCVGGEACVDSEARVDRGICVGGETRVDSEACVGRENCAGGKACAKGEVIGGDAV